MAAIGQQLLVPETGWRRYNDSDSGFLYVGSWVSFPITGPYLNQYMKSFTIGSQMSFVFFGSKLRIISAVNVDVSNRLDITIDGVTESFSEYSKTLTWSALVYEKILNSFGKHNVTITTKTTDLSIIDAIDIDSTGYLLHPILNQVSDIKNIRIGDCIPCRYTALTSNQVGIFSELGTTTAPLILPTSSDTPDGSFYWIYVGKDYLGRKKFIADRNIQHSISWETLNNSGLIQENSMYFSVIPRLLNVIQGGYIATASTSFSLTTPSNAFDKINYDEGNSAWITATNNTTGYLCLEFPSETVVNCYSICGQKCGNGSSPLSEVLGRCPKSWTFEGWNGYEWVVLDTKTGYTNWGTTNCEKRTFPISNTNAYKKYRLNITENNGSLSWVAIGELDMYSNLNNCKYYTRLLTGGVSNTDADNEWDQIIVNSTLNNTITAGDNNIWNWDLGVYSWCSTTDLANNANRIRRGGPGNINKVSSSVSSYAGSYGGFRPVLLVEADESSINYPVINNPVKTMLEDGLNISVDNITHKSNLPVKVKVYITKPNEFIVMKREYDAEFQPTPFTINNINFNIDEFDIGTNTITINVKDSNGVESNWSTNIIKSNTNKLLLLDGNKLKSSNLELLSEDYLSVEDNNLKQLFLTKGSTNNIKFNDDFKSQVENKDALKLLVLNIDLLK